MKSSMRFINFFLYKVILINLINLERAHKDLYQPIKIAHVKITEVGQYGNVVSNCEPGKVGWCDSLK